MKSCSKSERFPDQQGGRAKSPQTVLFIVEDRFGSDDEARRKISRLNAYSFY